MSFCKLPQDANETHDDLQIYTTDLHKRRDSPRNPLTLAQKHLEESSLHLKDFLGHNKSSGSYGWYFHKQIRMAAKTETDEIHFDEVD